MILSVLCIPSLVSAADDLNVRFYYGPTINEYIDYPIRSGYQALNHSAWNSSNPVVFYVHGMSESVDSKSTKAVCGSFLQRGGWNVIAINYATQAKYSSFIVNAFAYLVTQSGVVGEALGGLLNQLIDRGVPASSFYLVGYSIGAHVVGHAARTAAGTIPRITGLDPQLHGWFLFELDDHLWSTDATTVDVIHSNGILAGIPTALGTVDFYPNSGYALQPGCSLSFGSDLIYCSADVSWKYFAESVINPKAFEAISCDSWTEFEIGKCTGTTDYMGYGYSQKSKGNFYLQTNGAAPYSKGNKGIIYDFRTMNALNAQFLDFFASNFNRFFG